MMKQPIVAKQLRLMPCGGQLTIFLCYCRMWWGI